MTHTAPLLQWKDLVIDVVDPKPMAAFWSAATGLAVERREDGMVLLRDDAPDGERMDERAIWMPTVAEPHTVKNRVHVDVHTSSLDTLVRAGGSVVEDRGWIVMRDPEGGELCAFVRQGDDEGRPDDRTTGYCVYELGVDCAHPEAEARWWAERLGGEVGSDPEHGWHWVSSPGMPFESIVFVPVPEPKTVKNRVHWDVWARPGCSRAEAARELVDAGAVVLDELDDWTVLASPEGHEFCLFERPQD